MCRQARVDPFEHQGAVDQARALLIAERGHTTAPAQQASCWTATASCGSGPLPPAALQPRGPAALADALADAGSAVSTPAPRPGGPKVGAGMTLSSATSLPIAAR